MFWFGSVTKFSKQHTSSLIASARWWPFVLVFIQVLLGILTVISAPKIVPGKFGTFEILAELHQLFAMFLLMALVVCRYALRRPAN
jgi:cytochrome c oxidase assembly protein subunit 15